MKNRVSMVFAATLSAALALGSFPVKVNAQDQDQDGDFDHNHDFHGFVPGSIVLSGTVYVGKADTVTPGEVLPHGCLNTGPVTNPNPATVNVPLLPADQTPNATTTAVTDTRGYASDNGKAPSLNALAKRSAASPWPPRATTTTTDRNEATELTAKQGSPVRGASFAVSRRPTTKQFHSTTAEKKLPPQLRIVS